MRKIANLGINVFRLARTPLAVVDFSVVMKALRNKNIDVADYRAVSELCKTCEKVGASIALVVRTALAANHAAHLDPIVRLRYE